MLRRLGQDEEFAARHQRWQDDRRPQHDAPAGKWPERATFPRPGGGGNFPVLRNRL